jgi:hypothetical protein
MKCIEMFKYEESIKTVVELSWEEAIMKWSTLGYAAIFADIYDTRVEDGLVVHPRPTYNTIKKQIRRDNE